MEELIIEGNFVRPASNSFAKMEIKAMTVHSISEEGECRKIEGEGGKLP